MSMKKGFFYGIIGVVAIALIFFGVQRGRDGNGSQNDSGKIKVAATIFPAYDIAKQVAGSHATVELILPSGASPHTFDPTPSTLRTLQGAQRIFVIGQGLDTWAEGIVENIPNASIVSLDQGVSLRESVKAADDHHEEETHKEEHHDDDHEDEHEDEHEGEEADHGHHEHGPIDPHYWLDPDNARAIATTIANALSELDPDNAAAYNKNAQSFSTRVMQEDKKWKQMLADVPSREIITFHDAFFYLADHFDVRIVATFEPFPGREPTPSYLRELSEEINEHGVRVLYTEPQLPASSLEQFAKDNNITIDVLDPLGGEQGRDSYIDLIDYNVKVLSQTLQK